ncbi:carboxylesterase family protein [Williamsia sp. MIQD14]|uniref:carboxylesterase family protein n=1 Tax=Williamsia sp. MIQD14 TaxID=3425703 RepID=UPI003DA0D681
MTFDTLVVDTPSGPVRAVHTDGLLFARGMRYARARRFEPCVPVATWTDTLDATHRGPACPQLPSRIESVTGPMLTGLDLDEDCLRVSVTAPTPDGRPRPVMVWLHGGAYVSGGGESEKYDPEALARENDVVVVTVTYRLGILGYLGIDGVAPANLGLLDQIAALRWVRDTIGAFGGDPHAVTVFGHSAGADSIAALLVADGARGLFIRAVLQSAPLALRGDATAMSAAMGDAARGALGDDPGGLAIDDVLAAHTAALAAATDFGFASGMAFGPQYGEHPLPAPTEVAARRGAVARDVEVLIGWTSDDGSPFVEAIPRLQRLAHLPVAGSTLRRLLTAIVTRRAFSGPAKAFAAAHRDAGGRAVTYEFTWSADDYGVGACHSIEIPFLLGTPQAWSDAAMLGADATSSLTDLGPRIRRRWADFARDGVASAGSDHLTLG